MIDAEAIAAGAELTFEQHGGGAVVRSLARKSYAWRARQRREDTLLKETLYEENLLPVCRPCLLRPARRRGGPRDCLCSTTGWDADWSYWFGGQGVHTADLARASGFRLYSMLVQAGVHGLGGRCRTPDADRARARAPNSGCRLRPPDRGWNDASAS